MTTLADLISDISDDIDDTTGEYGSQIQKAILAAQRYCERKYTFYFNQTRDETFTTVASQQWYDDTDNDNISTLIHIQALWKEDSNAQRTLLRRSSPEELEFLSDDSASSGEPWQWAYFNQQIRLYPIPSDDSWTIRMQLGPYRLGALASTSDTNAWLDEAYDLIKARAKYILAKDVLKDPNIALESLNDFKDQLAALGTETSYREADGCIEATDF